MAKKVAKKIAPNQSFEETLWDSANKLRGSIESSEYKHVVLSLIFLKFVSDKFEERDSILDRFTQVSQDGLTPWLEKLRNNWPCNPINHEDKGGENE